MAVLCAVVVLTGCGQESDAPVAPDERLHDRVEIANSFGLGDSLWNFGYYILPGFPTYHEYPAEWRGGEARTTVSTAKGQDRFGAFVVSIPASGMSLNQYKELQVACRLLTQGSGDPARATLHAGFMRGIGRFEYVDYGSNFLEVPEVHDVDSLALDLTINLNQPRVLEGNLIFWLVLEIPCAQADSCDGWASCALTDVHVYGWH